MKRKIAFILAVLLTMGVTAQTWRVARTDGIVDSYPVSEIKHIIAATEEVSTSGSKWVDLGLPSGTLWATMNVGASKPEEYGDYFGVSTSDKDKATNNWGRGWCTPTTTQLLELIDVKYTTIERTLINNIYGFKVKSKINDNSIFLPAAGICYDYYYGSFENIGKYGYYLSSIPDSKNEGYNYYLLLYDSGQIIQNGYYSYSVRPVRSSNDYVDVSDITLSASSLTLITTTTSQFTATVSPQDATNPEVTWTSSNDSVATITKTGLVKAIAPGTCTITCTACDFFGVKTTCEVTVWEIILSQTSLMLKPNESFDLAVSANPNTFDIPTLVWTSSDESVAKVSSTGKVTAIGYGACAITCSAADDSGWNATCKVRVYRDESGSIDGRDYVDLDLPSGTMWATCNIGAANPENGGNHYAWGETTTKSWDTYGWNTYKYCKGSDTTLTKYCCDSNYGLDSFTDELEVLQPEDDAATANWGPEWRMPTKEQFEELINSNYTTKETIIGTGTYYLKITSKMNNNCIFLPIGSMYHEKPNVSYGADAYYWSRTLQVDAPHLAWHLMGIGVRTVSRNRGLMVRPVRRWTLDGYIDVTDVSLSASELCLITTTSHQLKAIVSPLDATIPEVTWTSSDEDIATVTKEGVVEAIAPGTCTITCKSRCNGTVTATCDVKVWEIVLSKKSLILKSNESYDLAVSANPNTFDLPTLVWTSSDEGVAKVTSTGKVTAVGSGSCIITCATTDDIGWYTTCKVSVYQALTIGGYDYVDLGLPSGTLWATCNVGATSPEEYGDYFAWGETTPKSTYDWSNYKYCNGTNKTLTKYCTKSSYGTVDNKIVLEPYDDAAYINWGKEWRMPTDLQLDELINNSYTTTKSSTWNGINGQMIISNTNSNFIFLPAAGYCSLLLNDDGSKGFYWSRSLYGIYIPDAAWTLYSSYMRGDDRSKGKSVRPVMWNARE